MAALLAEKEFNEYLLLGSFISELIFFLSLFVCISLSSVSLWSCYLTEHQKIFTSYTNKLQASLHTCCMRPPARCFCPVSSVVMLMGTDPSVAACRCVSGAGGCIASQGMREIGVRWEEIKEWKSYIPILLLSNGHGSYSQGTHILINCLPWKVHLG